MPTIQIPTQQPPEVIARLLDATERGDIPALTDLIHPDIQVEWPQSGERFSGRENAIAAQLATPVKPEVAGEMRVTGYDDLWVLRMPLRYGDDTYHYVGIFELEAGRVRRTTEYFAAPFPPNDARAPYADR